MKRTRRKKGKKKKMRINKSKWSRTVESDDRGKGIEVCHGFMGFLVPILNLQRGEKKEISTLLEKLGNFFFRNSTPRA